MVNVDRVKRKLPSLLVDSSTTKKKGWNSLMRYRYRFEQFKKKNPEKFNTLTNKLIADLTENEKTVDSLNIINKKKALNMVKIEIDDEVWSLGNLQLNKQKKGN